MMVRRLSPFASKLYARLTGIEMAELGRDIGSLATTATTKRPKTEKNIISIGHECATSKEGNGGRQAEKQPN